jgi:hypothetical protein
LTPYGVVSASAGVAGRWTTAGGAVVVGNGSCNPFLTVSGAGLNWNSIAECGVGVRGWIYGQAKLYVVDADVTGSSEGSFA